MKTYEPQHVDEYLDQNSSLMYFHSDNMHMRVVHMILSWMRLPASTMIGYEPILKNYPIYYRTKAGKPYQRVKFASGMGDLGLEDGKRVMATYDPENFSLVSGFSPPSEIVRSLYESFSTSDYAMPSNGWFGAYIQAGIIDHVSVAVNRPESGDLELHGYSFSIREDGATRRVIRCEEVPMAANPFEDRHTAVGRGAVWKIRETPDMAKVRTSVRESYIHGYAKLVHEYTLQPSPRIIPFENLAMTWTSSTGHREILNLRSE